MRSKKLGIKVISEACGIVPHTIRTWESRYQAFNPDRDENGQRLYNQLDLERAVLISKLLDHGHTISKLASKSLDELTELSDLIKKSVNASLSEDKLNSISIKKLFKHLSDYRIDKVASEIEHLRISVGAKDFIFQIVLPVMQKLGLMVAKGKYSVTQEHIVSTIVREQLGQINLPNLGDQSQRVVLATPDGNLHELSIIIADILCRANRVSTSYLGASHPPECLAEAVNSLKSQYIVMGVVSSDNWDYSNRIIPYLSKLDSYLNHNIEVVLGGGGLISFPKFENIKNVEVISSFEDFDEDLIKQTILNN